MQPFLKNVGFAIGMAVLAFSCSDDNGNDNVEKESYNTTFEIIDAPVDNAEIESIFVTVSDVKVNGTSTDTKYWEVT